MMGTTQLQNWINVKEIKFHHKVKRFYYKNLFRKIYTVAIIGLILANVFSMLKYQSFADEPFVYSTSSTDLECDYGYIEYNGECVPSNAFFYGGEYDGRESEDDIISVFSGGETILNLRDDPVEYGDGINTCGEGFHILNSDDVDLISRMDTEYFKKLIGEPQVTVQQEI